MMATDWATLQWKRNDEVILSRTPPGTFGCDVVGDPCIVWDDRERTWRMFCFVQGIVDGVSNGRTAMALSRDAEHVDAGDWRWDGIVPLTNPEALGGTGVFHKWWVLMDAQTPNHAACVDGKYRALFAGFEHEHKVIRSAFAHRIEGPWTLESEPVVRYGKACDVDGLHADTPSAFWFGARNEAVLFYKGYPLQSMSDQPLAPFGSSQLVASWRPGHGIAHKIGAIIRPQPEDGHWAGGWIGGLQLLPWAGGWMGLLNASPTPPERESHREPAPSLGGWAVCPHDYPTGGWRIAYREPLEWIHHLPAAAQRAGQGTNFWRHHLLALPDGRARIYYNSGAYGQEQMFSRSVD